MKKVSKTATAKTTKSEVPEHPGPGVPMAMESHTPVEREVDLWDEENPRAVINLVADRFRNAMLQIPDFLRVMPEKDLERRVRPTATDGRLRLAFWQEYNRAQDNMKNMNLANVFAGVCTKQYFFEWYLTNHERVAYMLTPPASYMKAAEEALTFGIERMRELLALDVNGTDHKGRPKINTSLAKVQLEIVKMLELRVKGAVVQKTMNAHYVQDARNANKEGVRAIESMNMDEVQARIAALEKQAKKGSRGPGDVKAMEAELVTDPSKN